nr:MAG TPA: Photosystem II reaction centre I protein (PSII 4.8 kDa protein) [Caudoviricetes sp.]
MYQIYLNYHRILILVSIFILGFINLDYNH